MLEQLTARGAEQAERRAATRREAIAASVSLPGVRAHVEGEQVVLEGRALVRRTLLEPGLRWQLTEVRHAE